MNRAVASSSWPSQTLWPAPHCVLWVLFTWLCWGDIIKCWVCFWAGRLWGAIFWDGNWLWGRRPVLRVIWWVSVYQEPREEAGAREFLPVVQVSAGEGNTMATGPASIAFSPTISQITRFPLSVPVPVVLAPPQLRQYPLCFPVSENQEPSDGNACVPADRWHLGTGPWPPLQKRTAPGASPRGACH